MLPREVHHSRTMVFLPSVVLDHKGPVFLGGALEGLWPHKLEGVYSNAGLRRVVRSLGGP